MRGLRPVRESLSPWSDSHYHAGISGLYGMFEPGRGAQTRKDCSVGCIACGICVKNCPADAVRIENNHAVIDEAKVYRLRYVCSQMSKRNYTGCRRHFHGKGVEAGGIKWERTFVLQ